MPLVYPCTCNRSLTDDIIDSTGVPTISPLNIFCDQGLSIRQTMGNSASTPGPNPSQGVSLSSELEGTALKDHSYFDELSFDSHTHVISFPTTTQMFANCCRHQPKLKKIFKQQFSIQRGRSKRSELGVMQQFISKIINSDKLISTVTIKALFNNFNHSKTKSSNKWNPCEPNSRH